MRTAAFALWMLVSLPPLLAACGDSGADASGGSPVAGCGDGVCGGESCESCPQDCGACPTSCGNDVCDPGESCGSCPHDCATACACGDGTCTNGLEDCVSCSADCGACPAGCPDGSCDAVGGETCETCSPDCGPCQDDCGDGTCGLTETCGSCADDCGDCPYCGDGSCDPDEDCGGCAEDCGACSDSCADSELNNDETDVDCGGSCPPCPVWWNCVESTDCESGSCIEGLCYPCDSATLTWNAPTTYGDNTCMPMADLLGFNLYWSQTSGAPYANVEELSVNAAGCFETTTPDSSGCGNLWECSYTIYDLTNGTWYFAVSTVAVGGVESETTPEVSKTFSCP